MIQVIHRFRYDSQKTQASESRRQLIIEHLYVKNATVHVSAELLNGKALSVPIPDLHLQDIGRKSDGVTTGEVTKRILGSIVQQVGTAMTSRGVQTTSNTIQKAVDSATQTIKRLF